MKCYKIKALRFYIEDIPTLIHETEDALYIIQELKNKFTIWEDQCGEFESGEDPIHAGLDDCDTLEEAHKILMDKGLVAEDSEIIDLEK